jgi:hypothetical protein
MHSEEEIRRTEAIQTAEVMRRLTAMVKRLRGEVDALKGTVADGEGPIAELLKIIADRKAVAPVRVEAATLVLAHAADERSTTIASGYLGAVARDDETDDGLKLDALRALAKRAVPKAPPPSTLGAASAPSLADRLKAARLRGYERDRPKLLTYEPTGA